MIALVAAQEALFLAVPVAFPLGGALVELLLPFGQGDVQLGQSALPVQAHRHAGVAVLLHAAEDAGEFAPVQEQLAVAQRVRGDVSAGGGERLDAGAEQVGLPVAEQDVGLRQVGFPFTQGFHFPAFQRQSGLEVLFQVVVEARLAVLRHGAGWCFRFFRFAHGGAIIETARCFSERHWHAGMDGLRFCGLSACRKINTMIAFHQGVRFA